MNVEIMSHFPIFEANIIQKPVFNYQTRASCSQIGQVNRVGTVLAKINHTTYIVIYKHLLKKPPRH